MTRASSFAARQFAVLGVIVLLLGVGVAKADDAVHALIDRVLPGHRYDFVTETIAAPAGENVFEVAGEHGKIVLRGDSPLSQAVALNWYLKHVAYVNVSWYADDPIQAPARLPIPGATVRKSTRLRDRFFLNYCTFGYSMPFWHWRDWERLIDWMALNGVSLPLAQTGNEYIWQKVWRKYGLSDAQIREYFTGPAFLPWHRMANIDRWDGPLPQAFIDGQHDLQIQIVRRERELGMSPVLGAFAGHVPTILKTVHPELQIQPIPPGWSGFSPEYGCSFLNPLDPNFAKIQRLFLREQENEYGRTDYFAADPFNEISPPSWDPAYLASVARAIYSGMADVDANAVWLQMSWTFSHDRNEWTDERMSAMIHALPPGRMELLDYFCEDREMYRETSAFFGAPFIWSYLGNFGGNTWLTGPLAKINERVGRAIGDPTLPDLRGIGATLEGLSNPVVYEFVFDRAWEGGEFDVAEWGRTEAQARAGRTDEHVAAAWNVLREKVLIDGDTTFHGHGSIFQASHPTLSGPVKGRLTAKIDYRNDDLLQAWGLLLQADPKVRASDAYRRDLLDVTRQALGNLGSVYRDEMAGAYARKDRAAFAEAAETFLGLGEDLDAVLATRTETLFGKWLADARGWGGTPGEAAYYEQDARKLVTIWGGNLVDYAGREQNGLLREYYLPRWQMLIDAAVNALATGEPIDRARLERSFRAHDREFAQRTRNTFAVQPSGDTYAMSAALFAKYAKSSAPAIETHRKE